MMTVIKFSVCFLVLNFLWTSSRGDVEHVCVVRERCILPCTFEVGDDVVIRWILLKLGDIQVHSYYHNTDQFGLQDQRFSGRTSLFEDQIAKGNASLQLTGVKLQDEGRYKCYTSTTTTNNESFINLKVEERMKADIAFLLDGSGSVSVEDFDIMKDFVKKLVQAFLSEDTQFSVSQYSSGTEVHYYFDNFFSNNDWEQNFNEIDQHEASTYTANAIENVVNTVFVPERGSRSNVKKYLIVITDGASDDRDSLPNAVRLAQGKNIVRFAIGVGNAFDDPNAKNELDTIASFPSAKHVFQVQSFDALERIRQTLQDSIFSIEETSSNAVGLAVGMTVGVTVVAVLIFVI